MPCSVRNRESDFLSKMPSASRMRLRSGSLRIWRWKNKNISLLSISSSGTWIRRFLQFPPRVEVENPNFFLKEAEKELIDQTVLQSMVPVLPILRMAYLIERDFAEFYRMAADRVEGKAKRSLEMLALWEKGHENLFKNLHDRAFEEYAQMPWGG